MCFHGGRRGTGARGRCERMPVQKTGVSVASPAAVSLPIERWTVRSFSKLQDKWVSPVSGVGVWGGD